MVQNTYKKHKRKKANSLASFLLAFGALSIFLGILSSYILKPVNAQDNHIPSADIGNNFSQSEEAQSQKADWSLILTNNQSPLPKNYNIALTKLDTGEKVDERIYNDLTAMLNDCTLAGYQPFVVAGFRTYADQKALMDAKIKEYINQGYDTKTSKELAQAWVAIPGTSEHQTGLAVDINDQNFDTSQDMYRWLYENSYKYGFILRYPAEKQDLTGINYEPWHFRYVGYEAAEEMFFNSLCLEEYLNNQ